MRGKKERMNFKLAEREKLLLYAAGILIFIYFVLNSFLLAQISEIFKANSMLLHDREQLSIYEKKIEHLKDLEKASIAKVRESKTKEEQTIDAIKYIAGSISSLGLDLVSIKPKGGEVAVGSAKAIFFEIDFVGSYNRAYRFMGELSRLPILILVDSMTMNSSGKGDVRVSIVLSVYY